MKNTTIIFIITLLLFTVFSENVKADNNSPVKKEQKNDLVEGVFKLAGDILKFSGDVLALGPKDKSTKVENTSIENINPEKQKTSAIGAFSLDNTLNGIAKSLGGTVDGIGKFLDEIGEGIGKSLEGTVNGLGKFLDDTGKGVLEVVEATADVAIVAGVVYLYMIAGSHHYEGHHHHHGYSH